MRGGGEQFERGFDGGGKSAQGAEMGLVGGELERIGELAVDEQVATSSNSQWAARSRIS
jgi:hypothetical protein